MEESTGDTPTDGGRDPVIGDREAFAAFGKWRHSAGLNMGDCASYALARAAGFPLLFKGADFARTDIRSAL